MLDGYPIESDELILKINSNSQIIKAVFVYDTDKKLIGKYKYEEVMVAQIVFKINHSIIKKYAHIRGVYNGYIFSYERLKD